MRKSSSFYDEIKFFPSVKYFPGIIGGHCVMPNIKILSKYTHSALAGGDSGVEQNEGRKREQGAFSARGCGRLSGWRSLTGAPWR